MSYPRNAVAPEPISIGAVVQISDGVVQTAGVTVRIKPIGVAEDDGAGDTAYSTDGVVVYTPTQAETDHTSFILIAKKTGCIPVSVTVVTSASATAGYAGVDWEKVANATATVNLSGTTIKAVTDAIVLPSIPNNWIVAAGINANALDGKGNWNIGKTGYSLTQVFPDNFAAFGITVDGYVSRVVLVDTTSVNSDTAAALTALAGTVGTLDNLFLRVGTARNGGGPNKIKLAATEDSTTLGPCRVRILSGAAVGEVRYSITGVVNASGLMDTTPAWPVGEPDATSVYLIESLEGEALAAVCTEARLAELDVVNLPADIAAVKIATDKLATMFEADGPNFRYTQDSLVKAPGGGSEVVINNIISALSTTMTLLDNQGRLFIRRDSDNVFQLTGLGNLTGYTKLYFGVKKYTSDSDIAAVYLLEIADGTLVIESEEQSGDPGGGSIVIDDLLNGDLTIAINRSISSQFIPREELFYMIKKDNSELLDSRSRNVRCDILNSVVRAGS